MTNTSEFRTLMSLAKLYYPLVLTLKGQFTPLHLILCHMVSQMISPSKLSMNLYCRQFCLNRALMPAQSQCLDSRLSSTGSAYSGNQIWWAPPASMAALSFCLPLENGCISQLCTVQLLKKKKKEKKASRSTRPSDFLLLKYFYPTFA